MKELKEGQGSGKLPVLSRYARTRGWVYMLSWMHRFTGIWLFIALMFHICYLRAWQAAGLFNADMHLPARPIFVFLAWITSLFASLHAFNGGRLLLYELYGRRNDADMIRWIFGLSAAYAAMVGLMMVMNNQRVSPFFFWLTACFFGAVAACVVAFRLRKKRHSVLWELQRISGAFLCITVPAYLLFLYVNPVERAGVQGTLAGIESLFTRLVTLILAAGTLYHAGYGLFSIAADYTPSPSVRAGITALVTVVTAVIAVLAVRLILSA